MASAAPAPSASGRQGSVYESPGPVEEEAGNAGFLGGRSRGGPGGSGGDPSGGVEVEVRGGRLLVVKARDSAVRNFFRRLGEDDDDRKKFPFAIARDSEDSMRIKDELNDDDIDGPNRRGTYSKSYILQHPEVEWVHRGQGRYLPASHYSRKSYSNRSDR